MSQLLCAHASVAGGHRSAQQWWFSGDFQCWSARTAPAVLGAKENRRLLSQQGGCHGAWPLNTATSSLLCTTVSLLCPHPRESLLPSRDILGTVPWCLTPRLSQCQDLDSRPVCGVHLCSSRAGAVPTLAPLPLTEAGDCFLPVSPSSYVAVDVTHTGTLV